MSSNPFSQHPPAGWEINIDHLYSCAKNNSLAAIASKRMFWFFCSPYPLTTLLSNCAPPPLLKLNFTLSLYRIPHSVPKASSCGCLLTWAYVVLFLLCFLQPRTNSYSSFKNSFIYYTISLKDCKLIIMSFHFRQS